MQYEGNLPYFPEIPFVHINDIRKLKNDRYNPQNSAQQIYDEVDILKSVESWITDLRFNTG